jgi:hypothetical protein
MILLYYKQEDVDIINNIIYLCTLYDQYNSTSSLLNQNTPSITKFLLIN